MNLGEAFGQFIQHHKLFRKTDRLLLAVSGGLDSTVLTDLCARAGFDFALAHAHFGLRGEESDRDEQFVRELAKRYDKPFFVKHFATTDFAETEGLSIQEAARRLRYQWFNELMKQDPETPFHYLLTAHHADDNAETLLMHLFRGTGIAGLKGIPVQNGHIVRPLSFARRHELAAYAQAQALQYVEDSSNLSEKYDRNFIRNHLLPAVRERYPQADENIIASITRFREAESIYREAVQHKIKKLLEHKGGEWQVPVRKLANRVPLQTWIYELFSPFGFSAAQTGEIQKLMQAETGKYIVSQTHRIIRNRNWLVIAPLQTSENTLHILEEPNGILSLPEGRLQLQEIKIEPGTELPDNNRTVLIDRRKLRFPLLVRKWKAGDYFYPLGMKKKKKLARFFIDQKLSKTEKEKIWVVESAKKIVWIIGYRIDERVKIRPGSAKGLLLAFDNV